MTRLLDFIAAPKGDGVGKVAVFLQGGRYGGDTGSISGEAPDLLAVTPCDCRGRRLTTLMRDLYPDEAPCGSPTHWHDVADADELGDLLGKHPAYYVLVDSRPARSGMTAALYWSAGHERPTRGEMAAARNSFARNTRVKAARARQSTNPEGV